MTAADLIRPGAAEDSASVRARVVAARALQAERHAALGLPPDTANAHLSPTQVESLARPDAAGQRLLAEAAEKARFSARAYHRILKVARTLADLEGGGAVRAAHLAEAIALRASAEGRLGQPA
ncbi:hypothetical protein [Antarcticirhabdus aurantiaca]|uniref:magnesium chelatase subunit ChlI family protein n=1 Tax=Antarcticirhabdus aurantiaca TaxID=2606717 RepID=UPI001FEE8DA3|nr:hypothetical protein [Antarcticirhabdus aurantiaca]